MTTEELKNIHGGAISASMINAIVRGVTILVTLGQYTGSAVRRITKKCYC